MTSNYTRAEMATELSKRSQLTAEEAKKLLYVTLEIMADCLVQGRSMEFRGFGTLEVVQRKPKLGRNPKRPQDGTYLIPAKKAVRFRASRELMDRLNPVSA